MNKILFCDFSFTDLSWVFGRAVTFGSAKKASFLCTHLWKGWPLSDILLFALQTCLGLGKVQANLAFALSFDRFINRSQCSHCSNFILRSLFSALLHYSPLCSLCSQSAPQTAIEVHWTSSCSNLLENRLKIPRNQFLEVTYNKKLVYGK